MLMDVLLFHQMITVQIVDNPVVSLTSTAFASSASSSTFCEGDSITFTATSTSAISTYTFSVGGIPQLVTTTNTFTPSPCIVLYNICFCFGRDSSWMYNDTDIGYVLK